MLVTERRSVAYTGIAPVFWGNSNDGRRMSACQPAM
jgi:hypothetical protein